MKYILLFVVTLFLGCSSNHGRQLFAIGTYSDTIHICSLDPSTGQIQILSTMSGVERPSFLNYSASTGMLYSVSEIEDGKVIAFKLENGVLNLVGELSTRGADPCCIDISSNGRWLATGNYSGGNITLISLKPDGSFSTYSQTIDHGVDSHIHDVHFSVKNDKLYVVDLGLDRLYSYDFMLFATSIPIKMRNGQALQLPPASGSRHMAYNQAKEYIYVLGERSGQVSVVELKYGGMQLVTPADSVRLATDSIGTASAEIALSPDGKYLYTSHRGSENSIVQYRIDIDGTPRFVEKFDCGSLTPRSFAIDPSGAFMIVGLQGSDQISVMSIDKQSGALTPTQHRLPITKPTHILPITEKLF